MILDTNALSAFADGDPAIEQTVSKADALLIPSIVLGEYRFGIIQSRSRSEFEAWLDDLAQPEIVLCPDEQTAKLYAHIRLDLKKRGRPIPYHDIWIGALAMQYDLPVLSRDRHFDEMRSIRRMSW